jgi:hypothetical protein
LQNLPYGTVRVRRVRHRSGILPKRHGPSTATNSPQGNRRSCRGVLQRRRSLHPVRENPRRIKEISSLRRRSCRSFGNANSVELALDYAEAQSVLATRPYRVVDFPLVVVLVFDLWPAGEASAHNSFSAHTSQKFMLMQAHAKREGPLPASLPVPSFLQLGRPVSELFL